MEIALTAYQLFHGQIVFMITKKIGTSGNMETDSQTILYFLSFVFGLCMGSFITMASHRLPRGEEIVFTPSHCPACNATLGFKDLFPLFSWIASRGACRHCGVSISVRYPFIELITGLIFVWIFHHFGISWMCIVMMLIASSIMILVVTDFEHTIIPDQVQIALLVLVVIYHLLLATALEDMLYGALAGGFTGLSLRYGFYWIRKIEGLGWGDVKLLPIVGLATGAKPLVLVLIASGLLGVLTGMLWRLLKKGPEFPFGPALALSMFVLMMYRDVISEYAFLNSFFIRN